MLNTGRELVQRLQFHAMARNSVVVILVIAISAAVGLRASTLWLLLLISGACGLALLVRPVLGLPVLIIAALMVPFEIGTGTEVRLNLAVVLVPLLLVLWVANLLGLKRLRVRGSAVYQPLVAFLAAALLSLLIGLATWDPKVPRSANLLLVQLAQWSIFAFSAIALWLGANLLSDMTSLRRVTFFFLGVAGALAVGRTIPGVSEAVAGLRTLAVDRAPFWTILSAISGGQLLFNRQLRLGWRVLLIVPLIAAGAYAFVQQRDNTSNWIGVTAAIATLVWLRFSRLRWPLLAMILVLAAFGGLYPAVYEFAGGEQEWTGSGGSRLVLIERVLEVTMRNPFTGLGPAAYRQYSMMKPLPYLGAYWLQPQVNSHNNYVDLFSHVGILGLCILSWFVVALGRVGLRVRIRYPSGFAAGYVNGMLAAGISSLLLMLFADWILPHVYNIGFAGFQASVLIWLFLGGLVALDSMPRISGTSQA